MKKLLQILSAVVVSTAFIGGMANAASCDGTITLTGPGSNNTINCNEINNIALTCNNNLVVGTVNTQNGASGNGSVADNTAGGNVATGQVVNDNGTNVTIGVTGCAQAAAPAGAPGAGGLEAPGGGGAGGAPAALPNTASAPVAAITATSVAILAAIAAASRMAVAAYRRFAIK